MITVWIVVDNFVDYGDGNCLARILSTAAVTNADSPVTSHENL